MQHTNPFTTPFRYHAQRIGKVLIIVALLAAVRPAFALFASSGDPEQTEVVTASAEPAADQAGTLASAATTGLDELFAVNTNAPDIDVTAALVKEVGTKQPLLVYRSNARWPLASLTKLMTAMVALDTLGPNTIITIPQEAVDIEGEAGDIKTGEKYSVMDLIRAMLTVSSNDAAAALAMRYDRDQLGDEAYGQALNKMALFTAKMQEKARGLGMNQSYFGDATGLSVINQSVLTDLDVMVRHVLTAYPQLLEITRQKTNTILERKSMTRRTLANINEFAGRTDFVGGKTGRTDEAGGNLISVFSFENKTYLFIVLGTEDRFGETRKLYDWVKDTKQVLFP